MSRPTRQVEQWEGDSSSEEYCRYPVAQRERNDLLPRNPSQPVFTLVADIQPGQYNLNLLVKIVSVHGNGKEVQCMIGDHTGSARALFRHNKHLSAGIVVEALLV